MLLRCNIRCCISMLYFDVTFRCCISMLYFDVTFRCYISMLHFMLHFYTTFTGYRTLFCSCLHIFFCIRTRSVRKRIRRIFRSRFSSSSQTFPILWDLALRFLPFEFCVLPPHSFGYSIIHTSFLQDTPDYSGAAPDTPDYSSAAPDTPDYSGAAPVQEAIWIKNVEMRNFNHSIQEKS